MDGEILTKKVYMEEVMERRGRPKKTWMDQIEAYLKDSNVRSRKMEENLSKYV